MKLLNTSIFALLSLFALVKGERLVAIQSCQKLQRATMLE
jgi:hypothetical protein